ncbi:hypothetical protein L7F22_012351 [Adiantum nelumboides]|nr:hypothetical protein [Adiantum nelumboides]
MDAYELLLQLKHDFEDAIDIQVETKYKTVAKKVKRVAIPLPEGSNDFIEEDSCQPMLRDPKNIGHKFTEEMLKQLKIGKDVPKAHLPKLIDLLNEKIRMGILKPSCTPYSNCWFILPKKNGTLRFIQAMQPVNKIQAKELEVVHSRVVLDLVFEHMILVLGGQGGSQYLDHLVLAIVEQELEKLAENRSLQDSCAQPSSKSFELVLYRKCESFNKKTK